MATMILQKALRSMMVISQPRPRASCKTWNLIRKTSSGTLAFCVMKIQAFAFLLGAAAATIGPAAAGPYSDDLAKCLVRSASPSDQNQFMRWMFSTLSVHPEIRDLAEIPAETRDAIQTSAGALFERLMTVDCRTEVVAALKFEGVLAFQQSFKVLGEIAARGLFSAPEVAEAMSGLELKVDQEKMKQLGQEAGTPMP